jgi:hypothetical protein
LPISVLTDYCKCFSNGWRTGRFFIKTAKTGTLTLDGGKSDFAPWKPPLSSEETHGLLRPRARLIFQQIKVLCIFIIDGSYAIKQENGKYFSGEQMSEILSVSQRTIERDLSTLQKFSALRHEGKDNDGVWVIAAGFPNR